MCGTSHDGLDLADVTFHRDGGETRWRFEVHHTSTVQLPSELKTSLDNATKLNGEQLIELDRDVARFTAASVSDYLRESGSKASFIGSHGVTVFHQPEHGLAWQAGNGGIIATLTGLAVISDFRIQDVSSGGTGAPLIPVADRSLFSEYSHTLNLGGFANITKLGESLMGYDLCACNLLLNALAQLEGLPYDEDGNIARQGKIVPGFLDALTAPAYFKQSPPKSLGYEWFEAEVLNTFDRYGNCLTRDLMATAVKHITEVIGGELPSSGKVLVTGGGARNSYLIETLRKKTTSEIVVPDPQIIDFREAIAFAFLGLLRLEGLTNTSSSVTGSEFEHSAGALYLPPEGQD